VRVEEVAPGTAAAAVGIRPGDVIRAINGKAIDSYGDLDAQVAASGSRALAIDVERDGRHMRLRALPRPMVVYTPRGPERHRVLGVVNTESVLVLMPCALYPDCE
jgi:regulator of sigma E protease